MCAGHGKELARCKSLRQVLAELKVRRRVAEVRAKVAYGLNREMGISMRR